MEVVTETFEMVEEGCRTPRHSGCEIPATSVCPPPPRKKPFYMKQRREPPKKGYFQPPDLDDLFTIAPRREACA